MNIYIDLYSNFINKIKNKTEIIESDIPTNISRNAYLDEQDNYLPVNEIEERCFQAVMGCLNRYNINYKIIDDTCDENYIYFVPIFDWDFFNSLNNFKIEKKFLDDIKNKKCKLLIDIPDDGYFKNITIQNLKKWCNDNNINEDCISIINMNLKSPDFKNNNFNIYATTIHSEDYILESCIPTEVCSFNNIEKLFLNYNRNIKRHKFYLGFRLYEYNLIDKGIFSFSNKHFDDALIHKPFDQYSFNFNKLYDFLLKLPYTIEGENVSQLADQMLVGMYVEQSHYPKTFLSLVSESDVDNESIYLSEKTFKPIVMGHPFILVGSKHSLKKLKEIGYKTFDKWWSEEYDNMELFEQRINAIVEILNDLNTKNFEELIIIREEMQEVIQHNFDLFRKRIKEVNFTELFKKILS